MNYFFSANSDITVLFVSSEYILGGTYYDDVFHSSHELIIDLNKNRLQQQKLKTQKRRITELKHTLLKYSTELTCASRMIYRQISTTDKTTLD